MMTFKPYPSFSRVTGKAVGKEVPTPAHLGFTLIELMIVMSVAGILTLIAMPKFDVARFQMDSAMRELGSAISAARGRAILRQHDHVLTFGENRFFVLEDTNNNGMADPEEERRTVELPHRIMFDRGGAEKNMIR